MSGSPQHTFKRRIVLERFEFAGLRNCRSWCGLAVIWLHDARTVVVATEREDNPGTSVTNAAELLATAVVKTFCLDPDKLVWVEHYAPGRLHGRREDLDLVTFGTVHVDRANRFVSFADPSWRPMQANDWQALGLDRTRLFFP